MDLDDACTLMALLNDKRPVAVGHVLSGWDMLQVDVPSRGRVENAASVLVGSGLAQLDEGWSLRLTAQGGRICRAAGAGRGMREVPGALRDDLTGRELTRAPLTLPASIFDPAHDAYLDRVRRRAERRSRRRWWQRWSR